MSEEGKHAKEEDKSAAGDDGDDEDQPTETEARAAPSTSATGLDMEAASSTSAIEEEAGYQRAPLHDYDRSPRHSSSNLPTPIRSNSGSILKVGLQQRYQTNSSCHVSFRSEDDHSNMGIDSTAGSQAESSGVSDNTGLNSPNESNAGEPGGASPDQPDLLRNSKYHVFENNRRISLTTDLETGKTGGVRLHHATVRSHSGSVPQSEIKRRHRGVKNVLSMVRNKLRADDDNDESSRDGSHSHSSGHGGPAADGAGADNSDDEYDVDAMLQGIGGLQPKKPSDMQYTLKASQTDPTTRSPFGQNVMYEVSPSEEAKSCGCFGVKPNIVVYNYLNWAFRSTFLRVFFSAATIFFTWTGAFAVLIFWSGRNHPQCIHVNGVDFGTTGADWMDAYALSWTTFSTVGYGLVYPATSATYADAQKCSGITILTTLESFVGILYASFCGAVMFAKVTRIASFAQVTFSDPMVIRYGTGIAAVDDDDDDAAPEEGGVVVPKPTRLPYPLLEFRVVNRRAGQLGGEIIDASMNIVASIDESQADTGNRSSSQRRRGGKKGRRRRKTGNRRRPSTMASSKRPAYTKVTQSVRNAFATALQDEAKHSANDDPMGMAVPKRVFVKLEIDSPEHPFFKRLWLVRHPLNAHSPLLKKEARDLIRMNNGHWPQELNNAEAIRASIRFDQILVSLSGTSNADANSVYAQTIYDFVDICVGYRFCNILFRNDDGTLAVDQSLLNDVTEQVGGGGEILTNNPHKHDGELFVL